MEDVLRYCKLMLKLEHCYNKNSLEKENLVLKIRKLHPSLDIKEQFEEYLKSIKFHLDSIASSNNFERHEEEEEEEEENGKEESYIHKEIDVLEESTNKYEEKENLSTNGDHYKLKSENRKVEKKKIL